ncbi:MAG: hypothetical protein EA398_05910 [Deltaproteobacteria bacterium]|nr:MAG: hypothetical protein EA398_05910 [Deltaproteobacteria bacterium]
MNASLTARTAPIPVLVGAILMLSADSAAAQASPGDWLLVGGPLYAAQPSFAGDARGAGLQAGVTLGLPRALTLGADITTIRLFPENGHGSEENEPVAQPFGAHAIHLGVGANVDVFTVIPWLQLAPGLWLEGPATEGGGRSIRPGVRISVGFDHRPSRSWSTGAALSWSTFGPDWTDLPDRVTFALRFGWLRSASAL